MTPERLEEIKQLHAAAREGPYRWNLNLKSKQIQLESIGCMDGWNETILQFRRWGMGGAKVCFNNHKGLIEPAECFAKPIPKREHHADWCQTVDHPDANLLAQSWQIIKELLEALETANVR